MPFVSLKDEKDYDQATGQAVHEERASFGETFGAGLGVVIDEELSISSMLNVENYNKRKQDVKRLVDEGTIDRSKYENYMGEFDYDRIAAETGLIKTNEALFQERNDLLASKRAYSESVVARGSGMAQFAGSMTGYVLDPVNVATMPIATAGTALKGMGILSKALRVGRNEAALGVAAETFIQPLVYEHKHSIDSPYEAEDAITAIVTAGIGAGILGGTVGGLSGYFKSLREKASPFVSKPLDDVEVDVDVDAPKRADTATEDGIETVKRANTPEEEALAVLSRMEDDLNAQKAPKSTDIEVEAYSKFKQGEYNTLADAKTATLKGLNTELVAIDKASPSLARWIADNGGLNMERWKSEGIDPADMKLAGGFGKPVFRKAGGIGPDDLAEKLFEIRRIPEFDSNVALDMVQDMVMNPKRKFSPEAEEYAKGLNDRIARLESTEDDLLESVYHDAIKMDIETDGDIIRSMQQRIDESNEPSRSYDDYIESLTETSSPKSTVTSRQSEILADSGLNKNYDDDIAAYNSLEDKRVMNDDGELVDGDEFMKAIDDEIEGIESVMRCAIG